MQYSSCVRFSSSWCIVLSSHTHVHNEKKSNLPPLLVLVQWGWSDFPALGSLSFAFASLGFSFFFFLLHLLLTLARPLVTIPTDQWRVDERATVPNLTQWLALIVSIWCNWMERVLARSSLSLLSLILYCNSCASREVDGEGERERESKRSMGWKRKDWRNWILPGREWARSQMATCSELGDGVVSFFYDLDTREKGEKKLFLLQMSIGQPKWPNLCAFEGSSPCYFFSINSCTSLWHALHYLD